MKINLNNGQITNLDPLIQGNKECGCGRIDMPDGAVKLAIITGLGKQRNDKIKSTLEEIVNDDSQEKFVIDEAHMQLIRFEQTDI